MYKNLHNLLSDAVEIQGKTPQEQERIIADLHAEIEANNRKIAALNTQGGMLGSEDSAMMLRMMQVLSSARQCCPQCQAAQMPMPQMNFSCCSAPQPVSSAMTAIIPFRAAPQPYFNGINDHLSDDLRKGAKDASLVGGNVRSLQNALNRAGANQSTGTSLIYGVEIISVQVTGVFDDQTERAVKLFQKQRGLSQTGVADTATLEALGISFASSAPSSQSSPTSQQNGSSAETLRLQKLLRAAGYSVSTDGVWGNKTQAALIKFQNANGLNGDGVVKEADWQKLQEIAGKKSGATSRAEAGKNTVPTVREKVADASDTLIRVVAPLVAGLGTATATYIMTKESNIPKKAILCAASGLGATALSYIGINALADKLSASPEETAVVA